MNEGLFRGIMRKLAATIALGSTLLMATPVTAHGSTPTSATVFPAGTDCKWWGCGHWTHYPTSDRATGYAIRNWKWNTDAVKMSWSYAKTNTQAYTVPRGTTTPTNIDTDGYWVPAGWYAMEFRGGNRLHPSGWWYRGNGGAYGMGYKINDLQRYNIIYCQAGVDGDACAR